MTDVSARAAQAERLAQDPLLIEAFQNVRAAAIKAWTDTSTDDQRAREVAWMTVKVANRIETELQMIIANGKLAASRVQNPLR